MTPLSRIRARATYANVTATLALFVALGGGSFAVAALSGSEKKVVKKIAKKQADKRITARAPGLTVEHAGSADAAPPTGAAGGDVTGTYPNPTITDLAVTDGKLADGAVTNAKLGSSSVTGAKVADGSLSAADVGKAAGVNAINFGSIPAGSCAGSAVSPGVDPDGEAIVVTPSEEIDNNGKLAISVQDSNVAGFFVVNACNVTGGSIDPPSANFSWVVFNN